MSGVEDMEKKNPDGRPYWLAKPELAKLPRCGPGGPASINKKPDMEALLACDPDVIFVTYMDAALADSVQKTLGIPTVVISYGLFATFDTKVYDAIRTAAKVLNRHERAEKVVEYIESLRTDLQARIADISEDDKPGVYVGGIGYRGAKGLESTEHRYTPFEWVDAENLALKVESSVDSHVFLDKEKLLELDPDIIFVDGGGMALVEEDYKKKPEFYSALTAFQQGRVHTLYPYNSYTTNIGTAAADAYAHRKNPLQGPLPRCRPGKKGRRNLYVSRGRARLQGHGEGLRRPRPSTGFFESIELPGEVSISAVLSPPRSNASRWNAYQDASRPSSTEARSNREPNPICF